jgi:uncharacterized protein YbcV (DUF1398 family)
MLTKEKIKEAQLNVKSGTGFPGLVKNFKEIGVSNYEHSVAESSTVYYDVTGNALKITNGLPVLTVSDESSAEQLKLALKIHQAGQTDYPTFCSQSAAAGVEKWVSDLEKMTVTYFDKKGNALVIENIPVL